MGGTTRLPRSHALDLQVEPFAQTVEEPSGPRVKVSLPPLVCVSVSWIFGATALSEEPDREGIVTCHSYNVPARWSRITSDKHRADPDRQAGCRTLSLLQHTFPRHRELRAHPQTSEEETGNPKQVVVWRYVSFFRGR